MTVQTAPLPASAQIVEKIENLQELLQKQAPGYESLLHQIHQALHKDEEMVHMLTEDQIGIVVAGLSKRKNIVIAETTSKSTGGKKSVKNLSLTDL